MRHFLDSRNVRDQLLRLRARADSSGVVPEEARDGTGRRLFSVMRDWYNHLTNPEYFDLGDLNLQFQSIYNYLGGELIDLPQLMQFADSYNAGDHCLKRQGPSQFYYDGMGVNPETSPQLFEDWQVGHYRVNGCAKRGVLTRGPALMPPVDRNPREFSRPVAFGEPLMHQRLGIASWASQPLANDYTRVSDWAGDSSTAAQRQFLPGFEFLEPKYILDGKTKIKRPKKPCEGMAGAPRTPESCCGAPPPVEGCCGGRVAPQRFRTALTRGYPPIAASYPAPGRGEAANLRCAPARRAAISDWIQYTLEPELLHDIQGNINRRFDSYRRCSGRRSDQRMVKLEVSLADDQVDRSALRLPNARAQSHCSNKKFPNEPLYYSSDPLANGSAYCNSESPFEDYI